MTRKPNYGIDSPGIVAGLMVLSALAFASGILFPRIFHLNMRWLETVAGAYFLTGALGMLTYSKSGKLRYREKILQSVHWRDDELVLDVGCGRGLLLIGAAQRLKAGRAIGVDIWVPGAVSGNRPPAVRENAILEDVASRVELTEGDATRLPFKANAFDVVVSNYVLHELKSRTERDQITTEMLRVLKPGGYLLLVDFVFTKECVAALRRAGVENARRGRLGAISFWAGAIMSFGSTQNYLVTARKPTGSN